MTEACAGLGGFSADEGDNWFCYLARFDEVCHSLFLAAANLAEHHDRLRLWIFLEEFNNFGVGQTDDDISTYVNKRCRADALLSKVIGHR